ncbi:MAG: GxxExxY protein [Segetibacter sp.]|jgi:GxxExxY protein|nr:GxxExxY protein [Segetibacter sp.]
MNKEQIAFQEYVGKQVVYISFQLHKALGPGLLESIYEKCFCYELTKRNISFITQKKVSIIYDNITFEEGLRLDLLVEDLVIVELKAQENYHPVWEAQLLSYLKLTNKQLGYIINFTVPLIKDGIKRMVLTS